MSVPVQSSFFTIIYCRKGRGTVVYDNMSHRVMEGDLCMLLPHLDVALADVSDNFACLIISVSQDCVHGILNSNRYVDNVFGFIHDNPVCRLGNTASGEGRASLYLDAILNAVGAPSGSYKEETVKHAVAALFCRIFVHVGLAERCVDYECNHVMSSRALVFRRFLQELNKDNGIHRSVRYYADILCYTSKYLSLCVSSVSGKTAHQWIDDRSIDHKAAAALFYVVGKGDFRRA